MEFEYEAWEEKEMIKLRQILIESPELSSAFNESLIASMLLVIYFISFCSSEAILRFSPLSTS